MKIPKGLWAVIIILFISSFVGLGFRIFGRYQILGDIANFSLVLTLVAVLFYVYYTYMLAKEAWTPSASFTLKPYPKDKYHFAFFIQNHSKVSLNCWCKLNPTVNGKAISLKGFYGGESSFDVQPLVVVMGHFHIKDDILSQAGYDLKSIKQETNDSNIKKQLYLKIDFWYNPAGKEKETYKNSRQPHYFDFNSDSLVADF